MHLAQRDNVEVIEGGNQGPHNRVTPGGFIGPRSSVNNRDAPRRQPH
jgi:hypothetical protein